MQLKRITGGGLGAELPVAEDYGAKPIAAEQFSLIFWGKKPILVSSNHISLLFRAL